MLRPDLYGENKMSGDIDKIDSARAQEYAVLSALLARAPDAALLKRLSGLRGDATPLGMAHIALAQAASEANAATIDREFFDLFIGIGRGELMPSRFPLSHRLPARATAGAAARGPRATRHRANRGQCRTGRSRRNAVRDHGRARQWKIRRPRRQRPADFRETSRAVDGPFLHRSRARWRGAFLSAVGTIGRLFIEIETEAFALGA